MTTSNPTRAVSTWSLHRTLDRFIGADSAIGGGPFMPQYGNNNDHALLELIAELPARGYSALQICHFHLANKEPKYLTTVRSALEKHEITLDALLIDDGDLTADNIDTQLAWYDAWLDVAEQIGANRARICAGRSTPTPERIHNSGAHLAALADRHQSIRIVTENWMELTPDADSLLGVLEAAGDGIGLLIDLGNWTDANKYEQLASIAPHAESCHAKCHFDETGPDEADFRRSLGVLKDIGFNGPLALIYDGPAPDEWAGLDREWEIVQRVFDFG